MLHHLRTTQEVFFVMFVYTLLAVVLLFGAYYGVVGWLRDRQYSKRVLPKPHRIVQRDAFFCDWKDRR